MQFHFNPPCLVRRRRRSRALACKTDSKCSIPSRRTWSLTTPFRKCGSRQATVIKRHARPANQHRKFRFPLETNMNIVSICPMCLLWMREWINKTLCFSFLELYSFYKTKYVKSCLKAKYFKFPISQFCFITCGHEPEEYLWISSLKWA